ncbi:MAG: helix-turn-helix transcriptional regulator [Lawsonibacter sp.]
MELNERLAQLRKEHGLSQNDLADQLKVSRQAVSPVGTGIGYAVQ